MYNCEHINNKEKGDSCVFGITLYPPSLPYANLPSLFAVMTNLSGTQIDRCDACAYAISFNF